MSQRKIEQESNVFSKMVKMVDNADVCAKAEASQGKNLAEPAWATADPELHRQTIKYVAACAATIDPFFAKHQLSGGFSLNGAYWMTFDGLQEEVTESVCAKLHGIMHVLIAADTAIERRSLSWKDAHAHCTSNGKMAHSVSLLESRVSATVDMDVMDEHRFARLAFPFRNVYSTCGPCSGGFCEIRPKGNGFLIVYEKDYTDQPALTGAFQCHREWGANTDGIKSIGELNQIPAKKGEAGRIDFAMAAEFRQEQKLVEIARQIHERNSAGDDNAVRVLAIAGPTSSGKTTFAHKLSIYLKNVGYEAKALSVDHYYLNLADQPKFKVRGERTDVDYDSIEAMDVVMVNKHINQLIQGEKVTTPVYDFKSGNRVPPGHDFELPAKGILIIEGIHALNPEYTNGIDANKVYKVYISPLTALQLDESSTLKTTYHRLLRRMTRDYKFRGYSAEHTLSQWHKVRNGEMKYIFKHQNNADFVMNSAMEHEVSILKSIVEPLLRCISPLSEQFDFAQRVLSWLAQVSVWPEHEVGQTAIFREFIGNGAYDKH